jgi:hypothetical protein
MRLNRHFDDAAIYPNGSDGRPPESVILVEHLIERWRVRRNEIRIVTGHFPLCTADLLGVPFKTLTILRDPVARTLSSLRKQRRLEPAVRGLPMEAIYDDAFRFQALWQNHMVKMLALTAADMTYGAMTPVTFTVEHLERAKERLSTIDVVGFQERFEDFCDELMSRFGWRLGPPLFANQTEDVDVPDSLVRRIAADNELDMELYAFACEQAASRGATG